MAYDVVDKHYSAPSMIDKIYFCSHALARAIEPSSLDAHVAALMIGTAADEGTHHGSGYFMSKRVCLPEDLDTDVDHKNQVRQACDEIIAFVGEVDFDNSVVHLLIHCDDGFTRSSAVAQFVSALYGRPVSASSMSKSLTAGNEVLTDLLHDAYLDSSIGA